MTKIPKLNSDLFQNLALFYIIKTSSTQGHPQLALLCNSG